MECCINCIESDYLINIIVSKNNILEKCEYCGEQNVHSIKFSELEEIIDPFISLYETVTNFMPLELLKEYNHCENMIWHKLTNDWKIFSDSDVAERILNDMYFSYRDHSGPDFLNDAVEIDDEWFGVDDSSEGRWESFTKELTHQNRFFPKSFDFETIRIIIESNETIIKKNSIYYRARINKMSSMFEATEMGSPPEGKATFGRMNPQGISYLYISEDEETSVLEIRSREQDVVNIGEFQTVQDLKVINVIEPNLSNPFIYKDKLRSIYNSRAILKALGGEISKPVNKSDSYLKYLPSQYICEFIKHLGYDGLIYKSSLNDRKNLVIFRPELLNCTYVKKK